MTLANQQPSGNKTIKIDLVLCCIVLFFGIKIQLQCLNGGEEGGREKNFGKKN